MTEKTEAQKKLERQAGQDALRLRAIGYEHLFDTRLDRLIKGLERVDRQSDKDDDK